MSRIVLFDGMDAAGLDTLWVTNGTVTGTYELTGISGEYPGGFEPQNFTAFDGEALFWGFGADNQNGLWVTNGSAAGTQELTGISGASANGVSPYDLTVFGSEVLFLGTNTANLYGLWVTNGTAAGTHELTGIVGANTSMYGLDPDYLTVLASKVLFEGADTAADLGLWVPTARPPAHSS